MIIAGIGAKVWECAVYNNEYYRHWDKGVDFAYSVCFNVPRLAMRRDSDGERFETIKQGAGIGGKKDPRGRDHPRPPTPPERLPVVLLYIYRVPLK
jgi:hypothetical protein